MDLLKKFVKIKNGIEHIQDVLKNRQQEPKKKQTEVWSSNNKETVVPPVKTSTNPVALCLVVPSLVVRNVKKDYPINISDIEKLIDNSLYFLCTELEEATQLSLETTDEDITNVSEQREIYIRINIANGESMIGKKIPYILKRNLPPNGQGVVIQLACLKYLSVSGLEYFNHI
ncbi:MAG: hypothetical protein ACK4YS_13570 [Aphanizomenon sp.]|jgi:hypothetical protein